MISETSDRIASAQASWRRERPELDTSPMGVIGRIHRIGDLLRAELIALYQRYGLGEGEFDVLATLRRSGAPYELTPGDIARHTIVTSGAVSKRVDRLQAAGLVTRRGAEHDRRIRVVALTSTGRQLIDEAFTAHLDNEHRLLETLSHDDRATLDTILQHWLTRLEPMHQQDSDETAPRAD